MADEQPPPAADAVPEQDDCPQPDLPLHIRDRRQAIAMVKEILRGPVAPDDRAELNEAMRILIHEKSETVSWWPHKTTG